MNLLSLGPSEHGGQSYTLPRARTTLAAAATAGTGLSETGGGGVQRVPNHHAGILGQGGQIRAVSSLSTRI